MGRPCSWYRAGASLGRSLYEDDEMSDAEIAQLVAALEESEQTAKREAEARQATQVSCLSDMLIGVHAKACSRVVCSHQLQSTASWKAKEQQHFVQTLHGRSQGIKKWRA